MAAYPRYAPEFQVTLDGAPLPEPMRGSLSAVSHQSGLEGADRVELTLVNDRLRWLDHPLLAVDTTMTLALGYAPDPLLPVFTGEIVSQAASFPSSSAPTLVVAAHDRLHRLQQGTKERWFAIPVPSFGNLPLPDVAVGGIVALEHGLIPIFDPVGAALSVLLGGVEVVAALGDPDATQKVIRKQVGESDFDFLTRIAQQNGWEMTIDHAGPLGGSLLHFLSPLDHLTPDLTLTYGCTLIDFSPRVTNVGQIAGVSARIWRPDIKMEFTVTVSWDWDRQVLSLRITPGFGLPVGTGATETGITLLDEPVTLTSAPRLILSKLIPRLNRRLTAGGSTIGDPTIQAGTVLQVEGVGAQFGGLYRVTSATHTVDSGGYRTSFDARKEIWFGSLPLPSAAGIAG